MEGLLFLVWMLNCESSVCLCSFIRKREEALFERFFGNSIFDELARFGISAKFYFVMC